MEQKLNKSVPKDIATVGECISAISGTYVVIQKNKAIYQSRSRGINLEFSIDSLKNQEALDASFIVSPNVVKSLAALSNGKYPLTYKVDPKNHNYRF